jgi:hypothetical protein
MIQFIIGAGIGMGGLKLYEKLKEDKDFKEKLNRFEVEIKSLMTDVKVFSKNEFSKKK